MKLGKYFTPWCVFGCICKTRSNWKPFTLTVKFFPFTHKIIYTLNLPSNPFLRTEKLEERERERERERESKKREWARNPTKLWTRPECTNPLPRSCRPPPRSRRPTRLAKLPLFSLFFLISSSLPFSISAPQSLSNPSLDPSHIDLTASTHPPPQWSCRLNPSPTYVVTALRGFIYLL